MAIMENNERKKKKNGTSSVQKPDESTFDENLVFNIIVQNFIRASNREKFRSR